MVQEFFYYEDYRQSRTGLIFTGTHVIIKRKKQWGIVRDDDTLFVFITVFIGDKESLNDSIQRKDIQRKYIWKRKPAKAPAL